MQQRKNNVRILAHGRKVLETNPEILQQKALYKIQDDHFSRAEKLLEETLALEHERIIQAVNGSVSPATVNNLVEAQLTGEELAAALTLLYDEMRQPVKAAIFPQSNKFLPAGWWESFIKRTVAERVVNILRTTRNQIKEVVDEAIREGYNIPTISRLIDQLYLEQIIPHRSRTIARTEVISASNAASYAAAKESGLNLRKRWVASPGERTRESHSAASGQRADMDAPFLVGASRLMYPGDSSLGASARELVNCRCTVAWVTRFSE